MVNTQPHQLTAGGLTKLEKELKQLREVTRLENIKALQDARAQGDLSENADYDAAREEQAKINGRITEVEGILKNYVIIAEDNSEVVKLGKTVSVKFKGEKTIETYTMVGRLETDPLKGKVSDQSPLGKALLGKVPKDKVEFSSETGHVFNIEVIEVN